MNHCVGGSLDYYEGSGINEFSCPYGGEYDERADIFDDEEYGNQCICDWHCPDNHAPLSFKERMFESRCHLYRDGFCKNLSDSGGLDAIKSVICNCRNRVGVLDEEFCGPDGGCLCKPKFAGKYCDYCIENHFIQNRECISCDCGQGAVSKNCDSAGKCVCNEGNLT